MTNNNTLFYHTVKEQIQSGKIEDALSELEVFLDENTDDEVALSLYSSALMRGGYIEKALNTFNACKTTWPFTRGLYSGPLGEYGRCP